MTNHDMILLVTFLPKPISKGMNSWIYNLYKQIWNDISNPIIVYCIQGFAENLKRVLEK